LIEINLTDHRSEDFNLETETPIDFSGDDHAL